MAVKDIVNQVTPFTGFNGNISSDTVTTGTGIDSMAFEEGVMVTVSVINHTDGFYIAGLQESDDDGASDPWTAVPEEKYCNTPIPTDGTFGLNSKLGVFSNKRYIRPAITSVGVTTGSDVVALVTLASEYKPTVF